MLARSMRCWFSDYVSKPMLAYALFVCILAELTWLGLRQSVDLDVVSMVLCLFVASPFAVLEVEFARCHIMRSAVIIALLARSRALCGRAGLAC